MSKPKKSEIVQNSHVRKFYNFQELSQDERNFLDVTGVSLSKFLPFIPKFREAFGEYVRKYTLDGKLRKSKKNPTVKGIRKNSLFLKILSTYEDMVLFLLHYFKTNPIQRYFGLLYGISQEQVCKWFHFLLEIAQIADPEFLPQQNIADLQVSSEAELSLDATECRICRPKHNQESSYSGKKKCHTKKVLVLADTHKRILWMSRAADGSVHDKKLADEYAISDHVSCTILGDLGFLGLAGIDLPHKRKPKQDLSELEKAENKAHAGRRIVVEHSFAGVKNWQILSERFRLRRAGCFEKIFRVACMFHNMKCADNQAVA